MQYEFLLIWCFVFNDTATTEIYTLFPYTTLFRSHRPGQVVTARHRRTLGRRHPVDQRPVAPGIGGVLVGGEGLGPDPDDLLQGRGEGRAQRRDRKSTRLNSSH